MSQNAQSLSHAANLRRTSLTFAIIAAFAGIAGATAQEADARGFRGGGGLRGGAAMARPQRGGGLDRFRANLPQRSNGLRAQGSGRWRGGEAMRGWNPGQGRPSGFGSANSVNSGSRFGINRGNGNTGVAGNGNTRAVSRGNGNTGVVGSGNGNGNTAYTRNGNTGVVGSGNVNNGNVNTGNVNNAVNTGNVAVGNDVDVNVNGGWSNYPAGSGAAYATGVAVGATTTAAVAGSYYYRSLPAGCSPYYRSSYQYYWCSGTWYQQQYQGGTAVYVTVADPTRSK